MTSPATNRFITCYERSLRRRNMPGEKVRGQSVDIGQKQKPLTKWQGPYLCLKNGAGEGSRTLDLLFTK